MSGIFWWIRQVIFTLAGCFFLAFGIILLISAYQLKDPFWFIMTFFHHDILRLKFDHTHKRCTSGRLHRSDGVCKKGTE
jgi:hypothetical protein